MNKFNSAEEAAARFSGEQAGNIYARFTNPTVAMFEQRIASLEGGERAVAAASGMAAIMSTCFALLEQGDHIVCSRSVFGTTHVLLEKYVKTFGVTVTFVDLTDYKQWEDSLTEKTRLLFLETPSNPLCEVADIKRVADIAHSGQHQKGTLLVVDNCLCTPILQRPLSLGADLVAISPEKPDNSLSFKEKLELEFDVFTDTNNAYAKKLGLVFKLEDHIDKIYKEFGFDLENSNGTNSQELPFPATLIVDEQGKILYSFIQEDYTLRSEPQDILLELKKSIKQ